jgi:hypothetical protein
LPGAAQPTRREQRQCGAELRQEYVPARQFV